MTRRLLSALQPFAIHSRGFVLIALLCLLALLYSLCLLQRCLCKWGLCRLEIQHTYSRCIFDVKKLWVFQFHLANVIEYRWIFVWLFNIVMMYLSLLDYHSFYYGFLETINRRCFYKVLADVGYANDRKLCIHKKRVCDVALACRRVGSKRVKVLSSVKQICYDDLSAYRQEVVTTKYICVECIYICCCFYNVGVRAYYESEYLDQCDLYNDGRCE